MSALPKLLDEGAIVDRPQRWSERQVLKLLEMAQDGHPASVIAPAIGKSRMAIIGRCHRHKIKLAGEPKLKKNMSETIEQKSKKPVIKTPRAKRDHKEVQNGINSTSGTYSVGRGADKADKADKAVVARVLDPASAPVGALMLSILDIEVGQCRWPFEIASETLGQKPKIRFCGCPIKPSSSWCEIHAKRAFVKNNGGGSGEGSTRADGGSRNKGSI